MKLISRFLSILLVLTIAMGLVGVVANASGDTSKNADGTSRDLSERSYRVYQIFTGTPVTNSQNSTDKVFAQLGLIEFAPIFEEDFLTYLKNSSSTTILGGTNPFADCASAQDIAKVLSGSANDSSLAQEFAEIVYNYVKSKDADFDGVVSATPLKQFTSFSHSGSTTTISTASAGYFVAIDIGTYDNNVKNLALLQVSNYDSASDVYSLAEFKLYDKLTKPTMTKKVKDRNDSIGDTSVSDWQDSADYDIGDDVPFQLKATMGVFSPFGVAYSVRFVDELDPGLTFNPDSVKVTYSTDGGVTFDKEIRPAMVGTTPITNGYTVDSSDAQHFTVTLPDLKSSPIRQDDGTGTGSFENLANQCLPDGVVIQVYFTAKLNKDAKIGSIGNDNVAHLDYSENPYVTTDWNDTETYSSTPDDLVRVFTYEVKVVKVDDNQKALAGAGFTLSKKVGGDYVPVDLAVSSTDNKVKFTLESTPVGDASNPGTDPVANIFKWTGLDDGDYMIHESTTPDGYNTAEDVYFTVKAAHDVASDNPALTSLGAYANNDATEVITDGGIAAHPAYSMTYGSDVSANAGLPFTIVNKSGLILPETGGVGTTIFYVMGGVMLFTGVVLLVTKKRVGEA